MDFFRFDFSFAVGFGLLLALVASGCSTVRPVPNRRVGLLGDLIRRDRANRMDGRGPAAVPVDSTDGEPDTAREVPAETVTTIGKLGLHWPLRAVQITSQFGKRGSDFHEGIDLRAKDGTPVYAAQSGVVLYANSKIRGYGKMVLIKHAHGISTVYAHNSRLLVKKGDHVRLGQKIAISGRTGRSRGPHVHFEVRQGVAAIDPAQVMPFSRVALADVEQTPRKRRRARHSMPRITKISNEKKVASH